MTKVLSNRPVKANDLKQITEFPQNEDELYFMFPKADYPLTTSQLQSAINKRFNSTVCLLYNEVAGFANFYEVEKNNYCSIGNVIVSPSARGIGIGAFLIQTMETIARQKHHPKEIRISCFNQNISGILLYKKLGYQP